MCEDGIGEILDEVFSTPTKENNEIDRLTKAFFTHYDNQMRKNAKAGVKLAEEYNELKEDNEVLEQKNIKLYNELEALKLKVKPRGKRK